MSDWRARALRPLKRGAFRSESAEQKAPEQSMDPRPESLPQPVESSVVDAAVCVRINATTSAGMTIAAHARLCLEKSSRATATHATSISSPEYVM